MKQQMLAKLAEIQKKIQTLKVSVADYNNPEDNDDDGPSWEDIVNLLNSQLRWIKDDISSLYQALYNHTQGHLPALNGANQMQKAIDVLGLSEDYDVQKKTIYASTGKPAKWIVELTPKKNA